MILRRLAAGLLLGLTLGCSNTVVDVKSAAPAAPLHIECRGHGSPPVVLEAGLGNDSSVWSAVLPELAKTTQVCAYDRAGMGASRRPAPRPHSNELMAAELQELLRATDVRGPYVLVGHSMGGANVRYLAAKSPAAVSGMVLVDSVSEQQPARFWALLPEATLAELKQGLARLPEGLDYRTFSDGLERLKVVSPSLGSLPLVVLAHDEPLPAPPGVTAELNARLDDNWHAMQQDLARLSSNSAYVVVSGAGHHIQLDRPDVVAASVNEVVAAVREARPIRREAILAQLQ